MLRLADIQRVVVRCRRTVALTGVILVLGVGALDLHAAVCDCNDGKGDGKACLCVAAEVLATVAAIGWYKRKAPSMTMRTLGQALVAVPERPATWTARPSTRAGPVGLAVLRL